MNHYPLMTSDKLVDYVTTERAFDLNHTIFPDREWEEVEQELKALAEKIIPDLHVIIKTHVDTLDIPDLEAFQTGYDCPQPVIPDNLPYEVARKIDENCPD